mmetsp:Transcript_24615/g.38243  ORF Transcript_24615/g.38243 Transcript_24615/m.38243 type:complete len:123 (+) Transcript_24615:3621-3989(+)
MAEKEDAMKKKAKLKEEKRKARKKRGDDRRKMAKIKLKKDKQKKRDERDKRIAIRQAAKIERIARKAAKLEEAKNAPPQYEIVEVEKLLGALTPQQKEVSCRRLTHFFAHFSIRTKMHDLLF